MDYVYYGLLWFSFGFLHSILARENVKSILAPFFGKTYRLSYNLFSVFHIGLIYFIGLLIFRDPYSFQYNHFFDFFLYSVQIIGVVALILALRTYNLGFFSGMKQLSGGNEATEVKLTFSFYHHFVRHPLYTASFLILWGNVRSDFDLMNAMYGSVYLIIGTFFEERQLVRTFGHPYQEYRKRVPVFIPYKGKCDLSGLL